MSQCVGLVLPDLLSLLQRFADSCTKYTETLLLPAALYMSPSTLCDSCVLRTTHNFGMLDVCCVVRVCREKNVIDMEHCLSADVLRSRLHRALQILSARQHAIGIVHSYPFIPEKHRVLELLASKRNEPAAETLTQSVGVDDLQHAANWQQIEEYLKTVTAQNMNQYIPLIRENTSTDASFVSSYTEQPLDPFV